MATNRKSWLPLEKVLFALIRDQQHDWSINTISSSWDDGPYVQIGYEDGRILAEITSNRYLRPILHPDDETLLRTIGWMPPSSDKFPNWHIWLDDSEESALRITSMWVRSLREAYQLPDDLVIEGNSSNEIYTQLCLRHLFSANRPGRYRIFNDDGLTVDEVRQTEEFKIDIESLFDDSEDHFLRELFGD